MTKILQQSMEQYLKHSNKCPKCRCDIDEKSLLFSKETQKQVSTFEVYCDPEPFKRCGWTGPYSELRNHLKKCPTISLEVPDKKFSINISSNEPDIDEIAKLNVEDIEKMSTKKLLKFSKDFGVSSENVLENKERVDKFIDSVYIPEMAKNFDMEHIPTKYLMRFLKLRSLNFVVKNFEPFQKLGKLKN
ncbi:hypothetical protein MHBO_003311 [Bonamia ostreae]|uniref:Uncharacterized protein n=1 Tax=Bonamia ostreae TaxID=126728 RepID=A0ABV2AQ39_9EUKA